MAEAAELDPTMAKVLVKAKIAGGIDRKEARGGRRVAGRRKNGN